MKRFTFAQLLVLLMVCCVACDCYAASTSQLQKILARKEIHVGIFSGELPPFIYFDKHRQRQGYDIAFARSIAKVMQVKLKLVPVANYQKLLDKVQQGEVDLALSDISRTLLRAERVQFSKAYLYVQFGLFANRLWAAKYTDNKAVIAALKKPGVKIAVLKDSSYYYDCLTRYPQAKLITTPDEASTMKLVQSGQVNVAIADTIVLNEWLHRHPDYALRVKSIDFPGVKDSIGIALNLHAWHLEQYINLLIDIAHERGFMKKLQQQYIRT